jgi:hypothetical protein
MKLHRALVFVAAFSSVTNSSFGQTVSGEKKGYQALDPDVFGSVELRYSVLRAQTGDDATQDDVVMSVRPTLGLKILEGKVTSAFTFLYSKNPGSMVLDKGGFFNETTWTAIDGKYGRISPYAYSQFNPDGNSFRFANIGLTFSSRTKFESDQGTLSIGGYLEPKFQLVSQQTSKDKNFTVVPRNETSRPTLAFDDQGATAVEQRDPTLIDNSGASVSFSPAQAKDLSTGFSVDFIRQWKPKYVTRELDGQLKTDFDAYERRSLTFTRWNVGYSLSEKVSLAGYIGYYMGGLYEYNIQNDLAEVNHELDNHRWDTRVSMSTVLF